MDVQRMLDVRITLAEPNCLSGTPGANHSLLCRDVGRTINAAAYTSNTAMTVESCVAYCTSNGYQYAGVEYYQECCKSWSSALRDATMWRRETQWLLRAQELLRG